MTRVLITGASGFVAYYVAQELARFADVVGMDVTPAGNTPLTSFCRMDVRDADGLRRVLDRHDFDAVVHAAAVKDIAQCEAHPVTARAVNLDAALTLHQLCRERGIFFVFLSSDIVFDGRSPLSLETAPPRPTNNYGRWKAQVERMLSGVPDTAICRTAMVFGSVPKHQRDALDAVLERERLVVQSYVLPHVVNKLRRAESIALPADEYCCPTSGFLLARQIRRVIEERVSGVLHCCGSERISRFEFGKRIAAKFGLNSGYLDPRPSNDGLRPKDVSLSTERSEGRLKMSFDRVEDMLAEVASGVQG